MIYTNMGREITEKIFFPMLVVTMVLDTYIITSDKIWVTLFNSLSNLIIYHGVSMVCDTLVMNTALNALESDFLYIGLRAAAFSIIIFLELKYIRKPFRHLVDVLKSEWYIATLAVILFSILIISMTIYPVMYYNRPVYAQVEIILAYALMAVIFYIFYVTYHNIIQKIELLKSDLLMKEKVEYMEKDKEISKTDPLTGVLNRRSFQEQITHHLTSEQTSALLIMDIDDFKQINDQLGHDTGDEALKALADALTASFRCMDVIARLGGDEFIVLLNNMQKKDESILQRIAVFKLTLHQILESRKLPDFSVSIGVVYTNGDNNFTKLYKDADVAMYESKDRGKDCTTFCTEELQAAMHF
ncbi:MAG: GGDEF domain-containing protein [Eubacteriales bacterium]